MNIPLKPDHVFIAGLDTPTVQDTEIIQRLGIKTSGTKQLVNSTESIKEWIKESKIKHLAIHLDLDVLDPRAFRSLLFANPEATYDFSAAGTMQMNHLLQLMKELSEQTDVVGLGITEHMPWDAINLKKLLGEIPILNKQSHNEMIVE